MVRPPALHAGTSRLNTQQITAETPESRPTHGRSAQASTAHRTIKKKTKSRRGYHRFSHPPNSSNNEIIPSLDFRVKPATALTPGGQGAHSGENYRQKNQKQRNARRNPHPHPGAPRPAFAAATMSLAYINSGKGAVRERSRRMCKDEERVGRQVR